MEVSDFVFTYQFPLKDHSRTDVDKRKRNEDEQAAKRRRIEAGDTNSEHPFSKEEIEAEDRKPKRKCAVMIGYAGSGYKGMQINGAEKTIEGDIFKAFVAAGAISKANADDPKKSSLVRCARTDKGVHAAGNVISLKLILEDPEIVSKINANLPDQIRVWGIERTPGSFSCYQTCDSRWYEYLIPTFCFLPPHPQSFLGRKLHESAEKENVLDAYIAQQEDVATFWQDTQEKYIQPILDELDPALAEEVLKAIHSDEEEQTSTVPKKQLKKAMHEQRKAAALAELEAELKAGNIPEITGSAQGELSENKDEVVKEQHVDGEAAVETKDTTSADAIMEDIKPVVEQEADASQPVSAQNEDLAGTNTQVVVTTEDVEANGASKDNESEPPVANEAALKAVLTPYDIALKRVKAAIVAAKKAYRISAHRKELVQKTLDAYLGTCNFHNYTIQKSFKDPSAKRHIKSFKVGPNPIIINDTEWLSLKVHGQSFMMHQIRKMVAMMAIVVRCGTGAQRIKESYGKENISIPKAPGLGLLLERPVFDSYNQRAVSEFEREKIEFTKYEKEMDEFKQRQIYDRIFREEEKDHQ